MLFVEQWTLKMVESKKKDPGLSLPRELSDYPWATLFLACYEYLQDSDAQQWAREYCGVILIHKPVIWLTFSGWSITLFAPACLVDLWPLQAVEFSAGIILYSRIHIQIVTVWASMMGDIFSLPATHTLRAFFFHCTINIC